MSFGGASPRRRSQFIAPFPGLPLRRGPPVDKPTFWTRGLGTPPSVAGERLRSEGTTTWRAMDPFRSKLAAALCRGLPGVPLRPGSDVLYLGGATGTTASHVADLVGPEGHVYVVEKSLRPFQRLLGVAEHYPNLLPLLGDVRWPGRYLPLLPMVDAIYMDVAQPDQGRIALEHAELALRPGGALMLALKTQSQGRHADASGHRDAAEKLLSTRVEIQGSLNLEPFHRKHYFLWGRWRGPAAHDPHAPRR